MKALGLLLMGGGIIASLAACEPYGDDFRGDYRGRRTVYRYYDTYPERRYYYRGYPDYPERAYARPYYGRPYYGPYYRSDRYYYSDRYY